MKSAWNVRTCCNCGRPLEPGESCNCQQPVKGLPRDGLRASCPLFQYRSSYQNRYFIACNGQRKAYRDCCERNEFYSRFCCTAWRACEIYKSMVHDEGSAEK